MSEEFVLMPSNITLSNIEALSKEQSLLEERRICELYELADSAAAGAIELFDDGMNVYEILSILADSFLISSHDVHDGALAENISELKNHISALMLLDRVAFCKLLCEKLLTLGYRISESDFLQAVDAPETFVYVKNAYANEAYDVFSQDFDDPRVTYAHTFKEALGLVSSGAVTYCLLPIEERGARLPTVAELLFKGDFKINSVIPVLGFDGLADMKYALVSKAFSIPVIKADDDRYLEIRVAANPDSTLSELVIAAKSFDVGIYRINTVTFDTDDGPENFYSIVLRGEGVDFTQLLTYLTLFSSKFTPVGLYKNLE